jgi:hypothetical protein
MGNRGFYSSTGKFCNGRPRKPLLQKVFTKNQRRIGHHGKFAHPQAARILLRIFSGKPSKPKIMIDQQSSLPFARAYWVVPGRLMAGYYPGDVHPQTQTKKLAALLDAGVDRIINLMEVDEVDAQGRKFRLYQQELTQLAGKRGVGMEISRFPIPDLNVPTRQQMRMILDALDGALALGRHVYVHCRGGIGRTGTVVGCFIARHGLAAGQEVLTRIAELRRLLPDPIGISPETAAQTRMVIGWQEGE